MLYNKQNSNDRCVELDILKGIAIFLVVLGHSGNKLRNFIYLFHVAVFFIASGYTYKTPDNLREYCKFVYKKIKRLYVPYAFYNLFFLCINHIMIFYKIYPSEYYITLKEYPKHVIKIFLLIENGEIMGAAWFLRILFILSLVYALVDMFSAKLRYGFQINVVLSIIGYTLGWILWKCGVSQNTYGMYLIILLTVYELYLWGGVLPLYMEKISSIKVDLLIFMASFVILVCCSFYGNISMGKEYGPYGFFVIASFCGWMFLWSVSWLIEKTKLLRRGFMFLSKESIYILIFHFCGFKVATYILILIKNDEWIYLSKFPIAYEGYSWFYTVIGLLVSVGIAMIIEFLKMRFKKANII